MGVGLGPDFEGFDNFEGFLAKNGAGDLAPESSHEVENFVRSRTCKKFDSLTQCVLKKNLTPSEPWPADSTRILCPFYF